MNDRRVAVRGDLPAELADVLVAAPLVAWDVETSGLDWRRDRLATCQVFAEQIGVVVVSLDEKPPLRLKALLEDPAVEKVKSEYGFTSTTVGPRPDSSKKSGTWRRTEVLI